MRMMQRMPSPLAIRSNALLISANGTLCVMNFSTSSSCAQPSRVVGRFFGYDNFSKGQLVRKLNKQHFAFTFFMYSSTTFGRSVRGLKLPKKVPFRVLSFRKFIGCVLNSASLCGTPTSTATPQPWIYRVELLKFNLKRTDCH